MKLSILAVSLFIGYLYGQTQNDPCVRACFLIYRPVCGSDNNTYSNKCTMEYAACRQDKIITVQAEGVCQPEPEEEPSEEPDEEPAEEEPEEEEPGEELPEEGPPEEESEEPKKRDNTVSL